MKKFVFISSFLVAMMFAAVSCGGNDPITQGNQLAKIDIQFPVLVGANGTSTNPSTPNPTIYLKDIITSYQDKASFVSTINRTPSYISITGLSSGATLNSVILATSDKKINATILDAFNKNPLVITRDTTLTGDNYTDILKQIGDYMATNKSVALTATCAAGNTIISQGTIKLHIETTFNWQ